MERQVDWAIANVTCLDSKITLGKGVRMRNDKTR